MSTSATSTSLRSPLGRVRGLGSAKSGTAHWWGQRLTALALIPLSIWFVVCVAAHLGVDHAGMKAWLSHPAPATMMILTIGVTFHHAVNGVQVVIEDYVHTECVKLAALVAVRFLGYALATAGIVSVLKIAFGS